MNIFVKNFVDFILCIGINKIVDVEICFDFIIYK